MKLLLSGRGHFLIPIALVTALLGGAAGALSGTCGPFTDVAADAFCPFVLEIFYLGITTGTTPTTYDPTSTVSRLQMAAFLSRSVDGVLKRGSRRASMNQLWTTQSAAALGTTSMGGATPRHLQFDGADIWAAGGSSSTVLRVRGSDARLLEIWTGATGAYAVVIGMNRVFVTGGGSPGKLFMIDPSLLAGVVTTVAMTLGNGPTQAAFDGGRVWTANSVTPGSVSIVTPGPTIPWTVTTFSVGIGSTAPDGIVWDGSNIWVTDGGLGTAVKLDASGGVLATVTVGTFPQYPATDGTSIWVPNTLSNSVTVIRGSTGAVLQTLTGNGLMNPTMAAFDGERVLVTNKIGDSVSLWKAADLTPLGSFSTGTGTSPEEACGDGIHFWIALPGTGKIGRF